MRKTHDEQGQEAHASRRCSPRLRYSHEIASGAFRKCNYCMLVFIHGRLVDDPYESIRQAGRWRNSREASRGRAVHPPHHQGHGSASHKPFRSRAKQQHTVQEEATPMRVGRVREQRLPVRPATGETLATLHGWDVFSRPLSAKIRNDDPFSTSFGGGRAFVHLHRGVG